MCTYAKDFLCLLTSQAALPVHHLINLSSIYELNELPFLLNLIHFHFPTLIAILVPISLYI